MRLLLFLFILFIAGNSGYAKTIYVSSSLGNEANDGLSDVKPLKVITHAIFLADTILLRCGDIFYSTGLQLKGKMLSCYGKGTKPIISGYKRIISPRWKRIKANIWRISLAEDNYYGVMLSSSMSNNVGCIHEYDKGQIHGHKVQYLSDLKEDWDMWQTERFDKSIPASEYDWLYIYYSGNPNDLFLEFSIADIAITTYNSFIKGVSIQGYGFGISAGSNTIIRNCLIDAIGGSTQVGYEVFTSYGNGIEFWAGSHDCLVENCNISRCYDCGCSIQGRSASSTNIVFRNNYIVDCCQGWEDFLSSDNPEIRFVNCVFEDNTVVSSGRSSGFGYPHNRFKYCHVLGNNFKGNKGMIIKNNTFIGGNYYCSGAYNKEYKSNVWEGNTCVIKRGDFILSNYTGSKDVIRIPTERGKFRSLKAATEDAIRRYRELTGDQTTRFIIKSEKSINKEIAGLKRKYLK